MSEFIKRLESVISECELVVKNNTKLKTISIAWYVGFYEGKLNAYRDILRDLNHEGIEPPE